MVLSFVRQHGRIKRSDVTELCRVNDEQAKILLRKLKAAGHLKQQGARGGAYYTAANAA